jgi:hypothetical protein
VLFAHGHLLGVVDSVVVVGDGLPHEDLGRVDLGLLLTLLIDALLLNIVITAAVYFLVEVGTLSLLLRVYLLFG